MDVVEIQKQCFEDSERWFPDVSRDLGYMVIALVGEVGEFANLYKKIERGTLELNEDTHVELAMELCDVFIYLCNMAAIMNVDLGKLYHVKRQFNEERFGAGSSDHADSGTGTDVNDEVSNDSASFVPVGDVSQPLQRGAVVQDSGQRSGGGSDDGGW